jgi:hypothetical protein
MVAQLYKGLMKVYTNQTNGLEGSTTVEEHKDKDQAAGVEIAESFLPCCGPACKLTGLRTKTVKTILFFVEF